jgi:hypothetical protein
VIGDLEKLLEAQSEDVKQAIAQEALFHGTFSKLDDFLRGIDGYTEKLQRDKVEQSAEYREQAELTAVKERKEQEEFYRILEEFREKIPSDIVSSWPTPDSGSLGEIFAQALSVVIEKTRHLQQEIAESPIAAQFAKLSRDYDTVLGHLDSARRFLHATASSTVVQRRGIRNELLAECARIGRYIEERKAVIQPSPLFDARAMSEVKIVSDVFLSFVNEAKLHESPFRELVSLFLCVGQLNASLVRAMNEQDALVRRAEEIVQTNAEQQARITELSQWKSTQTAINKTLVPVLSRWVENPPDDFAELSERFVEAFADAQVPTRERGLILDYIDALDQHVEELQNGVSLEEEKREAEKRTYCEQADLLVTEIESSLVVQERQAQETAEALRARIKELEGELNSVRELNHESVRELNHESARESKHNAEHRRGNPSMDHFVLQGDVTELQAQLAQQNAEIESLIVQVNITQEELSETRAALARESEKAQQYRSSLKEAESRNSQVLQEVKSRNDQLSEQYAAHFEEIVSENGRLKSDLTAKILEVEAAQQNAKQLLDKNLELQAKQRTLEFRLQEVENALRRERDSSLAKQRALATSVKSQCDCTVEALTRTLDTCREVFAKLLAGEFGVPQAEPSIEGVLGQINEAVAKRRADQALLADFFKLRRIMEFDHSVSLCQEFTTREEAIRNLTKTVQLLEDERKDLKATIDSQKHEITRLSQFKPEIQQWANWSRALLAQLMGPSVTALPNADVRLLLQEACFSSVGNRSLTFKLSSLRQQKKLLINPRFNQCITFTRARSRQKVISVRPLVAMLLLLRKIEKMAGQAPLTFLPLP